MGISGHQPCLRDVPLPRRPVHIPHDALHHPLDALANPFAVETAGVRWGRLWPPSPRRGEPHSPSEGRAGLGQAVAPADLGGAIAERSLDVGDGEAGLGDGKAVSGSPAGGALPLGRDRALVARGRAQGWSAREGGPAVGRLKSSSSSISRKAHRKARAEDGSRLQGTLALGRLCCRTGALLCRALSVQMATEQPLGSWGDPKGSRQVKIGANSHAGTPLRLVSSHASGTGIRPACPPVP